LVRKDLFDFAERIFMDYYVKNQKMNDVAWATSHFENDKINVSINDFVEKL
jgi:hypothetical protein